MCLFRHTHKCSHGPVLIRCDIYTWNANEKSCETIWTPVIRLLILCVGYDCPVDDKLIVCLIVQSNWLFSSIQVLQKHRYRSE